MSFTHDSAAARLDHLKFLAYDAKDHYFYKQLMHAARTIDFPHVDIYYMEMPRLELEHRGLEAPPLTEGLLDKMIRNMQIEGKNWNMPAFLWMLSRYKNSKLIRPDQFEGMRRAVLDMKYWIDEPNNDQECFFTENHQIIFHVDEYIAGQLYPAETFTNNGKTGRWHMQHAKECMERWFRWRSRLGFGEWLAIGYYDADLFALLTLYELTLDHELRTKAAMMLDILLFEYALNSFRGNLGSTHGRNGGTVAMRGEGEKPSVVGKLLWGVGHNNREFTIASVLLSASSYQLPEVIGAIGAAAPAELESRMRSSVNVEDAPQYGIHPDCPDDIMFFWGSQTYDHRLVIEQSRKTLPWENYFMNERIRAWWDFYQKHEEAGVAYDPDPDYTALTQSDIYTYKTPHYMLSCTQDYRRGKPGFEQHIWQATLPGDAVVFVSQPGLLTLGDRPDYWKGNGFMPKAVAHKNVLIALYRVPPEKSQLFCTHAFFPKHAFDQVVEKNGWIFGRKKNGYIALYSRQPGSWRHTGEAEKRKVFDHYEDVSDITDYDYIAWNHATVWICEMGSADTHGSFDDFISAVSAARVGGDTSHVEYDSPSLGTIATGWNEPLIVAGQQIQIHDYPRFQNPWCTTEFGDDHYEIEFEGRKLTLDFPSLSRIVE